MQKLMVPEHSRLRNEQNLSIGKAPGICETSANIELQAVEILLSDTQIQAIRSAFGKRRDAQVGVLPTDHRSKSNEGRQPAEAARRAMQSIGNTAAGIAAALTPWPSQKSSSNAALCNFFPGSKD